MTPPFSRQSKTQKTDRLVAERWRREAPIHSLDGVAASVAVHRAARTPQLHDAPNHSLLVMYRIVMSTAADLKAHCRWIPSWGNQADDSCLSAKPPELRASSRLEASPCPTVSAAVAPSCIPPKPGVYASSIPRGPPGLVAMNDSERADASRCPSLGHQAAEFLLTQFELQQVTRWRFVFWPRWIGPNPKWRGATVKCVTRCRNS